ncbi:hypothetical protein BSLG_006497 [Batrachochytrium salamandrivorans]|nr:hypothetical protein BASA62_001394 [Batrachochytrium salamandrivorans]KAJ1338860.1 hypothetical protein BSLG_006497 [Batrachochytrium salamandrivorans]
MAPFVSSMTSFAKLLRGKEQSAQTFAISASLEHPAMPWVHHMLHSGNSSPLVLVLVCAQTHPQVALQLLQSQMDGALPRVHMLDLRSGIIGTELTTAPPTYGSLKEHLQKNCTSSSLEYEPIQLKDLKKSISTIIKSYEKSTVALLFDSLESLLIQHSVAEISVAVQCIFSSIRESETSRAFLPFHLDVHMAPPQSRHGSILKSILMQYADVYIALRDPPEDDTDIHGIAELILKKRSGNVIREVSGFRLNRYNQKNKIELVPRSPAYATPLPTPSSEKSVSSSVSGGAASDLGDKSNALSSSKADPAANLSFNLSLTDDQRSQRSQVVLPYLQIRDKERQMENHAVDSARGATGLIHYQPDDADDYDDEDPDDDLDI